MPIRPARSASRPSTPRVLWAGASDADGIIYTAFGLDLANIRELAGEERLANEAFGNVYASSDRSIIVTGGVRLTPPGEIFMEDARPLGVSRFPARV